MVLLDLGNCTTDLGWFLSPAFFIRRPPRKVLGWAVSILMRKLNLWAVWDCSWLVTVFLFVGWTSVGLAFLDIFDRQWKLCKFLGYKQLDHMRRILTFWCSGLLPRCRIKLCSWRLNQLCCSARFSFWSWTSQPFPKIFGVHLICVLAVLALTCNSCKGCQFLVFFDFI